MASPLLLRAAGSASSLLSSRGREVPPLAVSALNALLPVQHGAPVKMPLLDAPSRQGRVGASGAASAESLLSSSPVGVKANLCVEGRQATAASAALQSYISPYTATAVQRALSAGVAVAGMTNMDEFGMGSASAFSVHGPARNPTSAPFALLQCLQVLRSESHSASDSAIDQLLASSFETAFANAWLTPGGSSGGSAAAVASGAVEAAFGSDTGGSVRQPAAFCGIVGLKPSYGRLSRWGLIAYASSLDTVGVLAKSTGDAALLFDLCAGHDPRDDTSLRLPMMPLAQCIASLARPATASVVDRAAAADRALLFVRRLISIAGQAAATAGVPESLSVSAGYCAGRGSIMHWCSRYLAAAAGDAADVTHQFSASAAADSVTAAVLAQLMGDRSTSSHGSGQPGSGPHALQHSLAGLRVGIPAEYLVQELPEASRGTVAAAAALLARCGAAIVPVSLPSTAAALSAYYLLASCEASSNLARYDGVRYGYRAPDQDSAATILSAAAIADAANAGGSIGTSGSSNAAQRLHELYKRTRTASFGREVQRRLMIGNFALSRGARAAYYEAARRVRKAVTLDFDAVFRPVSAADLLRRASSTYDARELELLTSASEQPLNRYLSSQSALGSASAEAGVDVLLTPTSPSPPWLSHETASQRAVDMYMNDVMTVPASLARLPALAIPVGGQAYPAPALAAYRAGAAVFLASDATAALGRDRVGSLVARIEAQARVPASVQLIGRFADESTLLRVGSALETAVAMAAV